MKGGNLFQINVWLEMCIEEILKDIKGNTAPINIILSSIDMFEKWIKIS